MMNREYYRAITAVLKNGVQSAPRGIRVLELPYPYLFTLNHQRGETAISTLKPFHTRLDYAEAELRWYLSGSARIDALVGPSGKSYAHVWKQFSDDGVNANSAYGQYIFRKQYIADLPDGSCTDLMSQWEWVKKKLRHDPDTRQAIININQPYHKETLTKDFPCCVCMAFTVRGDKLNLTTVFRSQDVNTGLRNDVYTMYHLQKYMAGELGMSCGVFMNMTLNLHLYEDKWTAARQATTQNWKK